jgi:hypothetical protein
VFGSGPNAITSKVLVVRHTPFFVSAGGSIAIAALQILAIVPLSLRFAPCTRFRSPRQKSKTGVCRTTGRNDTESAAGQSGLSAGGGKRLRCVSGHFDARASLGDFTDHRSVGESFATEDAKHFIDGFRRAGDEQAAGGLRVGQ